VIVIAAVAGVAAKMTTAPSADVVTPPSSPKAILVSRRAYITRAWIEQPAPGRCGIFHARGNTSMEQVRLPKVRTAVTTAGSSASLDAAKVARVIGDTVEVIVDTGTGSARTFEITATRAGRRVEVTTARGIVEVAELTRTGHPVRAGRFMVARVIAIVEHPAGGGAEPPPQKRRPARVEQEETLL
jgi:hypothetical protein